MQWYQLTSFCDFANRQSQIACQSRQYETSFTMTDSSPYLIEFANQQQSFATIDEQLLRDILVRVLIEEKVLSAEISIALVDHAEMRSLNKQYLNHDFNTDVLSFLLECHQLEEASSSLRGTGKKIEGQLIVCTEMAMESASQYGWDSQNELTLYLIHGLLHLLGYDDLTTEEQQIMRQRERELLGIWNLTPHYGK